jgi:pimeloyl-ACP methyl ester carboxylesterase
VQAMRLNEAIAKSGKTVSEQSIDLEHERFAVYVPPTTPENGYALLVFVLPWENATVPPGWTRVLDEHGMIFVTAARSGNETSVMDRREPLALLAAHNIMQRYRIDRRRIYAGGFSGGSRVAMRLALAYPDLFRGALLNAGSDPIGTGKIRLPPADLMRRFQETSRLVYVTGKEDASNIDSDARSRDSMRHWCVLDIATQTIAFGRHEVAPATALARGIDALEAHEQPASDKLASCRRGYEQELDDQLHQVETLQASGKMDAATRLLDAIDQRFGGLAAPRSIDLARRGKP